jgi:8-oxo-dGTP diphosphatase
MIRVAVGVIKRDDKVLVALRPPHKPYSGYWEFPGGKIENGESAKDALKRELHEELGIEVMTTNHCFDHVHTYPDKTVQLELWLVTEFSGEPHSRETQELRWVNWQEMQELKLLEGNWAIMERIKFLL